MENQSTKQINIHKVSETEVHQTPDFLAVEEPLQISLTINSNMPPIIDKNISITMRTPGADTDLALGFLFTEGIIFENSQVLKVLFEENKVNVLLNSSKGIDLSKIERHFYTSSSCGVCGKASIDAIRTVSRLTPQKVALKIDKNIIKQLPNTLRQQQAVFENTGGLHAAALFSSEGVLLSLREDVGRHNALDKLIGAAFQTNSLPIANSLLLLSGRASFELIQKAAMAGIQFIMAVGAPSSLAVELAEEFSITLIGFLSSHRFNIYTNAHRVLI